MTIYHTITLTYYKDVGGNLQKYVPVCPIMYLRVIISKYI